VAPPSPTVASWELGRRIRERRELLGYTGTTAGKPAGLSATYLSDIERGKKKITAAKLRTLLDRLEFSDEETAELHQLHEQTGLRGWWSAYSGMYSTEFLRFIGYEHGAESIRTYAGGLVPGLLQTEDYARAIIEAGGPNLRLAEVDRRVQVRMTRQRRLTGDDPLSLVAVLSEAALRQQIEGPALLAAQLQHLITTIDTHPDNLDVRVVPFAATGYEAMGGSLFHLLTFPTGNLPTLGWQETITSTEVIDDPRTVREYSIAYNQVMNAALDRRASLNMITECLKDLS
jgi:transcriptional regulator with XRE-family HTH domain